MSVLLKQKKKRQETEKAERVVLFEDEKTMITFWRFPYWGIKSDLPLWQKFQVMILLILLQTLPI